jgi:hypothetical protein
MKYFFIHKIIIFIFIKIMMFFILNYNYLLIFFLQCIIYGGIKLLSLCFLISLAGGD